MIAFFHGRRDSAARLCGPWQRRGKGTGHDKPLTDVRSGLPITPMLRSCNFRALELPPSGSQIGGIGNFRRVRSKARPPPIPDKAAAYPPLRAAAPFKAPPWFPSATAAFFCVVGPNCRAFRLRSSALGCCAESKGPERCPQFLPFSIVSTRNSITACNGCSNCSG